MRRHVGRVPLPAGLPSLHAMLTPPAAHAFDTLRVGASINDDKQWHAIHVPEPNVVLFELAHGKERERDAYNSRCIDQARHGGVTVLGEHAGFCDYFVPLVAGGAVHAVLISGPFLKQRPTAADVLSRWHWLTGRAAHPSDPEFSHYLSLTLDTLVLEGRHLQEFRLMLECFARLCASEGDAHELSARAADARAGLDELRSVERMWDAARSMSHDRTTRSWLSPHRAFDLQAMRLSAVPEHALVGLFRSAPKSSEPVAQSIARHEFQRACTQLARSLGDVIAGRMADRGVVLLLAGSNRRVRGRLSDVADRLRRLASRHGLSLSWGASAVPNPAPLSDKVEQASAAAERALLSSEHFLQAARDDVRAAFPIRQLRRQLLSAGRERPDALPTRFERYITAVNQHTGFAIELTRAHLEAGFDQAAQALLPVDQLEHKSFLDMCDSLDRQARDAPTVFELCDAYRRAVSELVQAVERPVEAARERSLQRAIGFIDRHCAEDLGLMQVSRIAGFAPGYFSRLFKQREGMTFEQYVKRLRVERAKQLLRGTDLSVERVGQMCGFGLRHYFHRVFKALEGVTPLQYRQGLQK